jgi:hypothetical protein
MASNNPRTLFFETSGTYTFPTAPVGLSGNFLVSLKMVGGGGGGGIIYGGGGGSGFETSVDNILIAQNTGITYTIGSGGLGTVNLTGTLIPGTNGGNTSLVSPTQTFTAQGGILGADGALPLVGGIGGAGGYGGGGGRSASGAAGGAGQFVSGQPGGPSSSGSGGGPTPLFVPPSTVFLLGGISTVNNAGGGGVGGAGGGVPTNDGKNATYYGGGGGGSAPGGGAGGIGVRGGNGLQGYIIMTIVAV